MLISRLDSYIRYCFYFIFAAVPLVMFPTTSELFELNKMWLLWGVSLIILFLWASKTIFTKKFIFRRTPLDIPLAIFFLSQLVSTIFSMDPYVSFWGYYSRFNGGLLSLICYIFLYYAFASNILNRERKYTIKTIAVLFASGIVVALWGFPSHFGYDPTCLVFRHSLDVSCWTQAFQPKVRIFSTLGQPNWLAAYLAVLIPIGISFCLKYLLDRIKTSTPLKKIKLSLKQIVISLFLFFIPIIFYIDVIWTDSQSGFLGLWAGLGIMFCIFLLHLIFNTQHRNIWKKSMVVAGTYTAIFIIVSIILGTPIDRLKQFSFTPSAPEASSTQQTEQDTAPALPALEYGGTDSSKIRLIVWKGALDIFKAHPLFGSGVETFAYAYYAHRPAEHNLTSEWDYLYNKAHNEYLNYLATTGIVGLGSYMLFIGWVIFLSIKKMVFSVIKQRNKKIQSSILPKHIILSSALFAGWVSILISNFFGFSVVIMNLFLFMLPLWILHLLNTHSVKRENEETEKTYDSAKIKMAVFCIGFIIFITEIVLLRYWMADKDYSFGNNLDKIGDYTTANQYLISAVQKRPKEDLFKDELAVNVSTLALLFQNEGQATQAAEFAKQAQYLSDSVIQRHPENVVYWKSRTRIMYSLAQIEPSFYPLAIEAIDKSSALAPTDARVMYNKALLYEEGGQRQQAIDILAQAITLKPNYRDALYAKALLHTELADIIAATDSAKATEEREKARTYLELILNHIIPDDTQAQELLNKIP